MAESDIKVDVPNERTTKRLSLRDALKALLVLFGLHRRAFLVCAGGVGFIVIASLSTVAVSNQPGFCLNCHEIRPAYDQWRTSAHYGVTCVNCHTEPGISGIIKVNVVGAQHLATHFLSDYEVPAEADVRDSSCLSCHPRESRPEVGMTGTLRIAHAKHNQQQCADCHGRLVHVNGAQEISTAPKNHAVRDCSVCHTEINAPHGDATLACTSCHSGLIPKHDEARVRGVMPRESCQECHQKVKVGSAEYCQTCHVSPHGVQVPCSRCHTSKESWTEHTFNHPVALVGRHTDLSCEKCHGNKTLSGLKYDCVLCHKPPEKHIANPGNCANCHSPEGWKPVKVIADHRFPQTHGAANGNCTACHPGGNTKQAVCTTCHDKAEATHAARGMTNVATLCLACHPAGKKP